MRKALCLLVIVLVALLVLSLGALGMVALGTMAARIQQTAVFHHRAVSAADDLAARIRANPAGAAAYGGTPVIGSCSSGEVPADICPPAALAAHDLAEWRDHHLPLLPAGTAEVEFLPDGAPPTVRIALRWTVRGMASSLRREVYP